MRLSICIPIFNQEVGTLVKQLHEQLSTLSSTAEILLYDDGSDNEHIQAKNRSLEELEQVTYRQMPVNLGRAAIRNQLGQAAAGTHLLFLDDDCEIVEDDFLINYERQKVHPVVCGGRIYPDAPPSPDHSLHWLYGQRKESQSATQRNRSLSGSFHSNNFMIQKVVFQQFPFDEQLTRYGHEDTVLGFQLHASNIDVQHIDNPVRHGRLETNTEFLAKSRLAVENLRQLYRQQPPAFINYVKLLRHFQKIHNLKMENFVSAQFKSRRQMWEENLLSPQPSLRIFSWYKLGYLCLITKND